MCSCYAAFDVISAHPPRLNRIKYKVTASCRSELSLTDPYNLRLEGSVALSAGLLKLRWTHVAAVDTTNTDTNQKLSFV